MVEITAVHMAVSFGGGHEHISSVRWRNPDTGAIGESSRQEMVDWLRKAGARAYVRDRWRVIEVGIVEWYTPYIRTFADGVWTDNLLSLPRF